MSQQFSRQAILQSLVRLDKPVSTLADSLRELPWDSDHHLVLVTRGNLASILDRFLQGEFSAHELESWANMIESREDVGFHDDAEARVRECLHELANPVLTAPFTRERAIDWLARLQS
jgi:hypothetical protein